jgi:ATP-dependent DNA helicase RecG
MQPSLDKIYKFFKLEAERGYDNRAVVGGLFKILPSWENEARNDKVPETIVQETHKVLTEYEQFEPEQRAAQLKDLWGKMQSWKNENAAPGGNAADRTDLRLPEIYKNVETERRNGDERVPHSEAGKPAIRYSPRSSALPRQGSSAVQGLKAPLTVIPGIGPRHAQTLSSLGLSTLGDLLYFFPRRYDDYSQLKTINRLFYGEQVTIIGTIQSMDMRPIRGGSAQMIEGVIGDGSGMLRLIWFNQPWIATRLRPGEQIVVSGKIDQYLGRLVINSPEWEQLDAEQLHTNRIVPVYPLTAHVTQRWLRRIMHQTVTYWAPRVEEYLPEAIRSSASVERLQTALMDVHFPPSADALKRARERLSFDEIFLLQMGVLGQKRTWKADASRIFECPADWYESQLQFLPYQLTGAQQKAIDDIRGDLLSGHPMNRLLQGDVGSGKTVVAGLAVGMVVKDGAQAAIMAPTGILAEQHYRNMLNLLANPDHPETAVLKPEEICLLVGDTSAGDKQSIRQALAAGEIKLIIGTHALIESPVVFKDLELVVVDEQHRFGVAQRAALRSKGTNPHLLVMTATPIPRSLALTVYGDLDLTVMDEMPLGRQPIETHVVSPRERERTYSLIKSQVLENHQAFIIYPLVEQGDRDEAKAAVEEHQRLSKEIFPTLKLGLLHGRLRPDEKEAVMAAFRDGEYQILVSTSVVEVGVDIPNATVMLIEGANRFGLAQLHQFRGRVGRGSAKSYCLLIPETDDAVENKRLTVMAETNDGFVLAERDLEQRGPGEFLGTRQAGYTDLRMANISDVKLIEKARNEAQTVFGSDPDLNQEENQKLKLALNEYWGGGKGDIS